MGLSKTSGLGPGLHEAARDSRDLERWLLAFNGVGPVTVNIFLRELRPYWAKADPEPLPTVRALAQRLRVSLDEHARKSLAFTRRAAGLIRFRHIARHAWVRAGTPGRGREPAAPGE